MRIKLVFDDWTKNGQSIYSTLDGIELSMRDFHSGTTFDGIIQLDIDQEDELRLALKQGYVPTFRVIT